MLDDVFYTALLQRCHNGDFLAAFAAPPCSTFSVARFFDRRLTDPSAVDAGPPPVRTREHITGLSNLSPARLRELNTANLLVARTAAILLAAYHSGAEVALENPADRGGNRDDNPHFLVADHGPIWRHPSIIDLAKAIASPIADAVTFPLCALGAPVQKYTTILSSARFADGLSSLSALRCTHESHPEQVGGQQRPGGKWTSSSFAAYPPDLNLLLAKVITGFTGDVVAAPEPRLADSRPSTAAPPRPTATDVAYDDDGSADAEPATIGTARSISRVFDTHSDVPPDPPDFSTTLPTEPLAAPPNPVSRPTGPSRVHTNPHLRGEQGSPIRTRRGGFVNAASRVLILRSASDGHSYFPPGTGCIRKLAASSTDPPSRRHALADDAVGWMGAERAELDNHRDNQSWSWINQSDLPTNRKLVRLVWVYKRKRSGKLKARLCVQGCAQVPGIDYRQTFCGAMRAGSLRLLAAVAARQSLLMHRWDFVAAYLQGSLLEGEVVYCHAPPGYEREKVDDMGRPMVCKVTKPIYGMAQAGRRWQRSLYPWLQSFGFTRLHSDPNVFRLVRGEETLIIGCYVDDMFTLHSHQGPGTLYAEFIDSLNARWEVEDEGEIRDLLNVEIERDEHSVTLRQRGYIDSLVASYVPDGVPDSFRADMTPAAPDLPALVQSSIDSTSDVPIEDIRRYQGICGALLYCATHTRPDIAYAVGILCRAMARPSPELYSAAQRVIYYLHRHRDLGLFYRSSPEPLVGFSDSDWSVRRSTSGAVFHFCEAAISWSSKKQPSVSLSSCEAELMAASEATKDALHLDAFLAELGLSDGEPVSLHVDNQAAQDIAYNPEHFGRVKHIERRHFFIREKVEELKIVVPFVRSADNQADLFTKPLSAPDFFRLRDLIMNTPAELRAPAPCVRTGGSASVQARGGVA